MEQADPLRALSRECHPKPLKEMLFPIPEGVQCLQVPKYAFTMSRACYPEANPVGVRGYARYHG